MARKEIIQPVGEAKAGCLTIEVTRSAITNNRRRVIELGQWWSLSITVRSKSWSEATYGGSDFEFFSDNSLSSTAWGDDGRKSSDTMRARLVRAFAELGDVFQNMPTLAALESAIELAFDAMLVMQSEKSGTVKGLPSKNELDAICANLSNKE